MWRKELLRNGEKMKIKIITAVLCIAVFAGSCISYSDYSHVFAEEHFEYEDYRYTILEDDTVNLYFYVDKTVESLDIPS